MELGTLELARLVGRGGLALGAVIGEAGSPLALGLCPLGLLIPCTLLHLVSCPPSSSHTTYSPPLPEHTTHSIALGAGHGAKPPLPRERSPPFA